MILERMATSLLNTRRLCDDWFSFPFEGAMKELKHEAELVKEAIREGVKYGESRGVVEFEPTDSAHLKIEYIYRLLVHDKVIQPLPEDQVSQKAMRHRLAMWVAKKLPKDHPLLK